MARLLSERSGRNWIALAHGRVNTSVIPAKAGIHHWPRHLFDGRRPSQVFAMDPGFRRGDGEERATWIVDGVV